MITAKRILVVDDEPENIRIVSRTLREESRQVFNGYRQVGIAEETETPLGGQHPTAYRMALSSMGKTQEA